MSTQRDPASFPNALLVVSSDIPGDMTIAQWRTLKRAAAPRVRRDRRIARILRRRRTR